MKRALFAPRASIGIIAVLLLTAACGGGSAEDELGYYHELERQQSVSYDDGEALARSVFGGLSPDAQATEWQPLVSQFFRDYASLLDGVADGLSQLEPPTAAEALHDEYVGSHRSLANELRESADELGPELSLEDAMGGMALTFSDFLGPACADLQRVAFEDAGEQIDLRCP